MAFNHEWLLAFATIALPMAGWGAKALTDYAVGKSTTGQRLDFLETWRQEVIQEMKEKQEKDECLLRRNSIDTFIQKMELYREKREKDEQERHRETISELKSIVHEQTLITVAISEQRVHVQSLENRIEKNELAIEKLRNGKTNHETGNHHP
jgi:predicted RNase H-like nuclease (RuvC/YqgF family)